MPDSSNSVSPSQSSALQAVTAATSHVEIRSRRREMPASYTRTTLPIRQRLSIIDASVGNFTPTGAIWYLDKPDEYGERTDELRGHKLKRFSPSDLSQSLLLTLDSYPHFAGRLRMVHDEDNEDESGGRLACNRLETWYDDEGSPGIEFITATLDARLDDLIPQPDDQADRPAWLVTDMPKEQAFCQGSIANGMTAPTSDGDEQDSPNYNQPKPGDLLEPCMIVQVTSLACGGVVIGVKISHPLADAHALGFFMREWSRTHAALVDGFPLPKSEAVFQPGLLDAVAMQAAKKTAKDLLLEKALSLPAHRFDWWDQAGAKFKSPAALVPEPLRNRTGGQVPLVKGQKMPWTEWDSTAKVEHVVLRFSGSQLAALRGMAQAKQNPNSRMPSTFDIVLAHIWSAINRARGYTPGRDDGKVHADITVGLRKRVDPPLPDGFVGSPLSQMAVTMPAHEACSAESVSTMAIRIRATNSSLTSDLMAAHIYGVMQESTPQRVWQVFLGQRHVLVTSWVQTGVFEVDFGGPWGPRHVHPIMPAIDGLVQVIESTPLRTPRVPTANWYDNGVNVNVYLAAAAMARLLEDPELHP